jgi:hypothetical protein
MTVVAHDIMRLDPKVRAREKRKSRERDANLLYSGSVSAKQLSVQNDFFAALDLGNFRIRAIGRRSVLHCEV